MDIARSWELFDTVVGGESGGDERSATISQSADSFIEGIVTDPAYQSGALVNGQVTPIVASRDSSLECSIKAVPGTEIYIGDMVDVYDEQWLVVELYVDKIGIINGKMWICNDYIKFQNGTPTINTRFCVVDDGSYSKKTSEKIASMMDNSYKIYISIDEETKKLFVDKRLALGQCYSSDLELILEVYKILGVDVKTRNLGKGSHLMTMLVGRDVYNAHTDSLEDNICDIIYDDDDEETPTLIGSCLVVGRDNIRTGIKREYRAQFINDSGEIVEDVEAVWDVTVPAGVTYTVENDVCTINAPLSEDLIGEEVVIKLTDSLGDYGEYIKKARVVAVG